MNRLTRFLPQWIDRRISRATGLTPISTFLDQDIFVAGYPKSGNTWLQYLLAGLYWGLDPIIGPDPLIQKLVPDVHYNHYYFRFATPMVFKTHRLPRPEYRRVVNLVRDGRDVMVSYYHHQLALQDGKVDFTAMVRDGKGLFPCKWHEHVVAWLNNPYDAEICLVKYEDLKREPLRELSRLCDFIQVRREREFMENVVARADFPNMQKKEKESASFRFNKKWAADKSFIRRGAVGSYQDEMAPDILAAFLREAGDALEMLHYV